MVIGGFFESLSRFDKSEVAPTDGESEVDFARVV